MLFELISTHSYEAASIYFSDGKWKLRGSGLVLTSELVNGQARI